MRRRKFLSALSTSTILTGGCVTENPYSRVVKLLQIDKQPSEYNLKLNAEMVVSDVTNEHTATIRLSMTNEGKNRSPDTGFQPQGRLWRSITRDFKEKTGLWLFPQSYSIAPRSRSPTCWEPPRDWERSGGTSGHVLLDPGETFKHDYTFWGDPETEGCMKPGKYHFGFRADYERGTLSWLFTVEVKKPPLLG